MKKNTKGLKRLLDVLVYGVPVVGLAALGAIYYRIYKMIG